MDSRVISPFGGGSTLIDRLHVSDLARRYKKKCGVDVAFTFVDIEYAELYQCHKTGYKFWYPFELAGNEHFYHIVSRAWKDYYRTERWEYQQSRKLVKHSYSCLEVGCGRGYFLRSIEKGCALVVGLELNTEAISEKVCTSAILNQDLATHARCAKAYDVVFSFQVLEHIATPREFLNYCLKCLKPGGLLVLSVPNDEWIPHQKMQDAFNLPPHHMGGYSKSVVEAISRMLGTRLIRFDFQPCNFPEIDVGVATRRRPLWRFFNRTIAEVGALILRTLNEPGHTMMFVLQKSE